MADEQKKPDEAKKPREKPSPAPAGEGGKPAKRNVPPGAQAESGKAESRKAESEKAEAGKGEPGKGESRKGEPRKGESRKAEPKMAVTIGEQVKPVKVRLRDRYEQTVVPALQEKFKFKNRLAAPRLNKICLNIGFGKAATENQPKLMEQAVQDLTLIAGQKAVITLAKKSISNFKVRQGMKVGCRVTLRGARMYEFFDRLVNVAIPRIRDFRGLSRRAFDGRGNYSLGLQEQTVFPEIEADKAEAIHGLDVTICTTARSDELAFELLKNMGMPFREH